jgi:protein FAM50
MQSLTCAMAEARSDVKRTDTGVFTVEGNVAGRRAAGLTKAREREKADFERRKQEIEQGQALSVKQMDAKFSSTMSTVEDDFKAKTVGLVTVEEFRKAREVVAQKKLEELAKLEECV